MLVLLNLVHADDEILYGSTLYLNIAISSKVFLTIKHVGTCRIIASLFFEATLSLTMLVLYLWSYNITCSLLYLLKGEEDQNSHYLYILSINRKFYFTSHKLQL